MAKTIKSAPDLPDEVTGPIEKEDIIELNDKVEGPIDDKLAELLKEDPVNPEPQPEDNVPEANTSQEIEEVKKITNKNPGEDDGIIDDDTTEKAIDEIVAAESDVVLEAEDRERLGEDELKVPVKKGKSFSNPFSFIWSHPPLKVDCFGRYSFCFISTCPNPSKPILYLKY